MTEAEKRYVDEVKKGIGNRLKIKNVNVADSDLDYVRVQIEAAPHLFDREALEIIKAGYKAGENYKASYLRRILALMSARASIPEEIIQEANKTSRVDPAALIPVFKLEENEIEKISKLCGDMRKIVLASELFDQPHRVRLLNRIAAIEAEANKDQGIFDVVRGGINDLGETLGKFGENIKPLTDRMNEVVSITRRRTKEYDKLPEPDVVKKLPPPEGDKGA